MPQMICVSFWALRRCCLAAATWMRCHASQPIMAGSTRVVSSPLPETSLLARSCNKAERERYFVFGESLRSRYSRSSTTLMRDGKVPVASSKGRPNRTLTISRSSIVWCESMPRLLKIPGMAARTRLAQRSTKPDQIVGWSRPAGQFSTQSGPDASAQSVEQVARLSRNVRQPNHVLAN